MRTAISHVQILFYCTWSILLLGSCGSSNTVTRIGETKYPGTSDASPIPIFWPSNAGQQPENLLNLSIPARITGTGTIEALYDPKTEKAVPFEKASAYIPIGLLKMDKKGDQITSGHIRDMKRHARRTGAHAILIRIFETSDGYIFIEALFIRWKERVRIR